MLNAPDGGDEAQQDNRKMPHILRKETDGNGYRGADECCGIQDGKGIPTHARQNPEEVSQRDDEQWAPGGLQRSFTIGRTEGKTPPCKSNDREQTEREKRLTILGTPLFGTERFQSKGHDWGILGETGLTRRKAATPLHTAKGHRAF